MPSFPSLTAPLNTSPIGQQAGLTPYAFSHNSASGAVAQVIFVQTGPCQLFGGSMGNTNGQFAYLKVFDVASPTVVTLTSGTVILTSLSGASAVQSFLIPGNAAGAGSNLHSVGTALAAGIQLQNGLAIAITANPALADVSGVSGGVNSNLWVR